MAMNKKPTNSKTTATQPERTTNRQAGAQRKGSGSPRAGACQRRKRHHGGAAEKQRQGNRGATKATSQRK
eukprot:7911202-Pyramimonas_sp.AAC.1